MESRYIGIRTKYFLCLCANESFTVIVRCGVIRSCVLMTSIDNDRRSGDTTTGTRVPAVPFPPYPAICARRAGGGVGEKTIRVASRKVSMGFLENETSRETNLARRDFSRDYDRVSHVLASRDQPCETRLLARLESPMVLWKSRRRVSHQAGADSYDH